MRVRPLSLPHSQRTRRSRGQLLPQPSCGFLPVPLPQLGPFPGTGGLSGTPGKPVASLPLCSVPPALASRQRNCSTHKNISLSSFPLALYEFSSHVSGCVLSDQLSTSVRAGSLSPLMTGPAAELSRQLLTCMRPSGLGHFFPLICRNVSVAQKRR